MIIVDEYVNEIVEAIDNYHKINGISKNDYTFKNLTDVIQTILCVMCEEANLQSEKN